MNCLLAWLSCRTSRDKTFPAFFNFLLFQAIHTVSSPCCPHLLPSPHDTSYRDVYHPHSFLHILLSFFVSAWFPALFLTISLSVSVCIRCLQRLCGPLSFRAGSRSLSLSLFPISFQCVLAVCLALFGLGPAHGVSGFGFQKKKEGGERALSPIVGFQPKKIFDQSTINTAT